MAINQTVFIRGSVGKGAVNSDPDVRAIQTQLNGQMPPSGFRLAVDGRIGPKTNDAICDFQKSVLGFRRPDGRVDPNGKTLRALNDPASESKWARMCVASPQTTYIEFDEPMVIVGHPSKVSSVWFGGGYKGGTTLTVVGIETTQIVCVAADGRMGFTATVSGTRFPALGFGTSGGPLVTLITSMNSPGQLSNLLAGGRDFSLAVGPKLESVVGSARYGKAVKALTDFAAKYGNKGAAGLKAGEALVKYNGQIYDLVKALGMKLDHHEPQILSLGIPWGGFGLEASVHFTVSKYHVESVVSFR